MSLLNKKAPNFKLLSTSGKIIELNKIKSKFIIIYFYPKDNTSGCTIETNDFNKLLSKFEKLGCSVFGISKDSAESHQKWSKKLKLKFELLADEDNLREVVAFPMNQQAEDLLMKAPNLVSEKNLKELGIEIKEKNKK